MGSRLGQSASSKRRLLLSDFAVRADGIGERQSDGVLSCGRSRGPRRPMATGVHSAQRWRCGRDQWMRQQLAFGARIGAMTEAGAVMLEFDLARAKRATRLCRTASTGSAGVAGGEAGARKTIESRRSQNHSGEGCASVRRLAEWELWTEHHRLRRAGDGRRCSGHARRRRCYRRREEGSLRQ